MTCGRCSNPAYKHRLTHHGTLYCLVPGWNKTTNHDIKALRNGEKSCKAPVVVLNTCRVEDLQRSDLPDIVGRTLAHGMVSHISESA